MLEFLSLPDDVKLRETQLESAIISHLRSVLMELGRGFCFVARQRHIRSGSEDFFIDLVFYNCILKCYVLIDLKMGKVTHKDVGQMDMYRRMFDELICQPDDNPTIGIVLCDETDANIAKYSVLAGNDKLYAVKYSTVIPSEDVLRREIAAQKELFRLQMQGVETIKSFLGEMSRPGPLLSHRLQCVKQVMDFFNRQHVDYIMQFHPFWFNDRRWERVLSEE